MGSILIRGKDPALVSLHPDNPELFIAVSNPSRSMKNPILPEKREKDVIAQVFENMKKFGVSLGSCTPPIKEMKGALLFVTEESVIGGKIEFVIRLKSGRKVLWEEYRKNSKDVRMVENDEAEISKILTNYTKSHAQRLLSYISNRNSVIEFKHIGRDGGGTQGAVSTNDVGAYQLLNDLTKVYPSAIEHIPGNILKFRVLFGPLMWHLTKALTKVLHHLPSSSSSPTSSSSNTGWGAFGEADTREMREYQTESVEAMAKAHSAGRKGSFINIETGRGKTKIVLEYLKWLLHQDSLPDYVIYTLPDSAIESVITEITTFGADYTIINPLKSKLKSSSHSSKTIQGCKPMKFRINLIEHDHLRLCTELPDYMGESVFIFDEVHKALRESLRTDYGLQLSNLSVEFIALTGTPIIDQNTYRLMWWLSQISPFEVTEKNFFVSAAGMISKRSVLPAKIERNEIYVTMTPSEEKRYALLVPSALGGTNANPRNEDFSKAFELCYEVITRKMVDDLIGTRAFVVTKDRNHQQTIVNLLLEKGVTASDIFTISKGNSIFFTDESVESNTTPDYKYVITTQAYSTGYTLTRLNTMVTSVYPSNQATREQLDGRINRIGQKAAVLNYNIYHTGLLTHTLQRYNDAKSLSDVLKSLASEIKD
jgi:superfamily II DNA or RNA helicase